MEYFVCIALIQSAAADSNSPIQTRSTHTSRYTRRNPTKKLKTKNKWIQRHLLLISILSFRLSTCICHSMLNPLQTVREPVAPSRDNLHQAITESDVSRIYVIVIVYTHHTVSSNWLIKVVFSSRAMPRPPYKTGSGGEGRHKRRMCDWNNICNLIFKVYLQLIQYLYI